MILDNNQKAEYVKRQKTKPDFYSILKQILTLDNKKRTIEAKSKKWALRAKKKKA